MCTKKLSRKFLPGMRSYGLGNLCKELKIEITDRHRASGDARATVKLFEYLLQQESDLEHVPLKGLNSRLSREEIMNLPESPGVYYFHEEDGNIIYIGKSINIKSRILAHLSNNLTKRAVEMRDRVVHITYELTGSELVALLLESDEIKKYKPVFNRSLRRSIFNYGLFSYTGTDGYIRLSIERLKGERLPLTSYTSREEGRNHLIRIRNEFALCQKLCGLYHSDGTCFEYHIGDCKGACAGIEPPESYNDRVIDAISKYSYMNKNFFIIDDGRSSDEVSVVKVENGRYVGFGYVEMESIHGDSTILHDVIRKYDDNKDVHVILRGFLRKNSFEKLIIY